MTSSLSSSFDLSSAQPVTQQNMSSYDIGFSVSTSDIGISASATITSGQLQIVGDHNTNNKTYDTLYTYTGGKDTNYRKLYSQQRGTFAILTHNATYFENIVSFTIDFGMYATSSLFTKDLPTVTTVSLSLGAYL